MILTSELLGDSEVCLNEIEGEVDEMVYDLTAIYNECKSIISTLEEGR